MRLSSPVFFFYKYTNIYTHTLCTATNNIKFHHTRNDGEGMLKRNQRVIYKQSKTTIYGTSDLFLVLFLVFLNVRVDGPTNSLVHQTTLLLKQKKALK